MDNNFIKGTSILLFILFIFCLFIAYDSENKINSLESELSESKAKIGELEDTNLILNYKLCQLKQNEDADCESIAKEIALKAYLIELIENR